MTRSDRPRPLSEGQVQDLLRQGRDGSKEAAVALFHHLTPHFQKKAHGKLDPRVHRLEETADCLQEALLYLCTHELPPGVWDSLLAFRAYMTKLLSNGTQKTNRKYRSRKRDLQRETPVAYLASAEQSQGVMASPVENL